MKPEIIIAIVAILLVITVIYRLIPHRVAGKKKPSFALFPKYKIEVDTQKDQKEIEQLLVGFGFKNTKHTESTTSYTRGSVLGDFSIKLAKVNIKVEKLTSAKPTLYIEAGWLVLFDTGDFWVFLNELSDKIENA